MPSVRLSAALRLLEPVLGLGFIGIEIAIGIEIGFWLFSYQSAVFIDFDSDPDFDFDGLPHHMVGDIGAIGRQTLQTNVQLRDVPAEGLMR